MTQNHLSDTRFDSLNLAPQILQGLEEAGFSQCTPIQAASLPLALEGKDIAGQAQTGTGKTAAFLLATYSHLLKNPAHEKRKKTQPRAVILAPTRELAIQIHKDAMTLGKHTGLKQELVYGGTGYESQRKALEEGVDVLIGTPGRIIDYFKQHVFDLKAAQVVVMDEADRMFDLGFIADIRYLLRRMPKPDQRLGLLFSATLSLRVTELAYEHMNHPEKVVIEAETITADKVTQAVYHTANDEKIPLLLGLLKKASAGRSIVFVNTKRAAEKVYSYLMGNGYKVSMLSGDVPQKKRQRLLEDFTNGVTSVMVATDVAARGLHIPDVSHVYNYDLPDNSEDYVHRIGRTARLGASGDAVSFACEHYAMNLMDIESYLESKIPMQSITADLLLKPEPPIKMQRKPRPGGHNKGPHKGKSGNRPGQRPRRRSGQSGKGS